ncbi:MULTISPECIES: hypothetical protein [Rhodococcus]|uniref:Uncharacterized protein n=1 Tax=Rhodococcus aetherivorans TaxID=191292 RepID=N1M5D6_9NOCA|nr:MULTISPECIES: hypothetical protein [Rhodococcus]MBC2590989.1 hypothetical protein [Rhodococcus aetherivorans]MDV6292578.1 hypothetical protein [Rhodococcus aetherivorans]NGP24981.1 hypothetical protein [Rhodococcus aetherivorans]QIX48112.1 hypothetical protein HFP48_08965 [Rhodococcus sp. DMU1]QPG48424.1 hypothetical protein ISO16_25795 [Rhodococcus sp. M8]
MKASRVAQLEPKKKCCRKKTRCVRCPVVIMRMKRLEHEGLGGKELAKRLKKARAA